MKIAVIGTGHVGGTLGRRLAQLGHEITFGSRQPQCERVQQLVAENPKAHSARSSADAVADAEVVVFAAPWPVAQETIESAGDLSDKILIDCTNPLNQQFDDIELGYNESAAEKIAQWAVGAKVVKAFNTVSVKTMEDPNYGGQKATLFFCGDDADARDAVGTLIEQLGFEPIQCGALRAARYLEPMAMLYIQLAVHQGMGSQCALKMLKR